MSPLGQHADSRKVLEVARAGPHVLARSHWVKAPIPIAGVHLIALPPHSRKLALQGEPP